MKVILHQYKAKVIKVIDGDTFDAVIDLGFKISVKDRFRMYGVDTPELRTRDKKEKKRGLMVKNYVKDRIEGKEIIIKTQKQGKFGRYLADVFINGECLNTTLIMKGYANEYYGGKR